MSFPNAYSQVYYNEDGEVLGWDNPSYDAPEYCDDCGGRHNTIDCPMDQYDDEDD